MKFRFEYEKEVEAKSLEQAIKIEKKQPLELKAIIPIPEEDNNKIGFEICQQ